MHQADRINYLLNRYLNNTCSRQEMGELLDYVQTHPEDEHLMDVLQESWDAEKAFVASDGLAWAEMKKSLRDLSCRSMPP